MCNRKPAQRVIKNETLSRLRRHFNPNFNFNPSPGHKREPLVLNHLCDELFVRERYVMKPRSTDMGIKIIELSYFIRLSLKVKINSNIVYLRLSSFLAQKRRVWWLSLWLSLGYKDLFYECIEAILFYTKICLFQVQLNVFLVL